MTASAKEQKAHLYGNQYNHEGIRISKTESGATRRYYYDNGILAYTKDGATVSSANVLSGDGDILGTYRGEDYHVYTKDVQNSVESIVKEDGSLAATYSYSDFGETEETTESSFDNEICYTGAVYDAASGLYYMNARYYDPANGRFISQDTYRGSIDNPGQWHLYAYCANNPINYVDPSGHARKYSKFYVCLFRSYTDKKVEVYLYFKSNWRYVNSVKYFRISVMEATGWRPEVYWEKKNRIKNFRAFMKDFVRLGHFYVSNKVKYAFVNTYNVKFYDVFQSKWVRFTNILAEIEIDKRPLSLC